MTLCDRCPHRIGDGAADKFDCRPRVNCEIEGNILAKVIICPVLIDERTKQYE